ncbi:MULTISPECIES: 50S ribosomal protein L5 [Sorangium]|uniref:Large ribosomal subunit protein uL5 n=1 Tax=Sorangium cellulosum (strain So ce56) TaxID=448385 RepID=A9FGH3_SORC5|nr:50S ribosomal protein L5 [Sorangium cellulosum So ce56]
MADKKDKDKAAKDAGKGKDKDKPKPQQAKPQAPAKSKEAKGAKAKGAEAEASGPVEERPRDPNYAPRLRTHYRKSVTAALAKKFGYKNPMMVPRLQKVVINMGLGAAVQNPKIIDSAVEDMRAISGQKPVVTRARKSIATFKLRENLPIGVMVTLRAERMWEFVDRLIAFSLPRVRDFKGVSPKGFDGKGNFTMGLREQIIFPEIDYDKIDVVKGLNISFVTTAKTDEEGRALLTELGIPFRH